MNLKSIYLITAALTFVIFFSGTYLFYSIYNPGQTTMEISSIRSDLGRMEDELILLMLEDNETCPVMSRFFIQSNTRFNEIGYRLGYISDSGVQSPDFESLKEEFMSLSVKSWLLSKQMKKNCDPDIVPIMFFYSYPCQDCKQQEGILDDLKVRHSYKVVVYSMDTTGANVTSPASLQELFISSYRIDTTPALLINSKVYTGLQPLEFLEELISSPA
jgi:hypothetical protein